MKTHAFGLSLGIAWLATVAAQAQDLPQSPEATKEHKLLDRFVGEWTTDSEGTAGPDQPAMKAKGSMHTRKLGDYWVICDIKNDMMGTTITAVQTLGYDAKTKKYLGTWVDSLTDYMWKYEGTLDPSGKILTFEAEGPNFLAPGKTAKFRDVYEFKSDDHIVATSSMLSADGKWVDFMTGNLRRVKK